MKSNKYFTSLLHHSIYLLCTQPVDLKSFFNNAISVQENKEVLKNLKKKLKIQEKNCLKSKKMLYNNFLFLLHILQYVI